jgi:hypothetical protein
VDPVFRSFQKFLQFLNCRMFRLFQNCLMFRSDPESLVGQSVLAVLVDLLDPVDPAVQFHLVDL